MQEMSIRPWYRLGVSVSQVGLASPTGHNVESAGVGYLHWLVAPGSAMANGTRSMITSARVSSKIK